MSTSKLSLLTIFMTFCCLGCCLSRSVLVLIWILQKKKKKKMGGELDDIFSEVAARAKDEPIAVPQKAKVQPAAKKADGGVDDIVSEVARKPKDEPVVPMNAGITPMEPGPIKADPIAGMECELPTKPIV